MSNRFTVDMGDYKPACKSCGKSLDWAAADKPHTLYHATGAYAENGITTGVLSIFFCKDCVKTDGKKILDEKVAELSRYAAN